MRGILPAFEQTHSGRLLWYLPPSEENPMVYLLCLLLALGTGCVLPSYQYGGDDDDNDDASDDDDDDDDDDTGDDDTGDDDTGDDDTGDDDTGDDDTGDDDTGDDDTADDDTGDDDTGDDDTGDDDDSTPPGPVLFIEDVDQWGTDAWDDAFAAQGVPYTTIGSMGLAATNLDLHPMVVTSSVQGEDYNLRLLQKMNDFQSYVVGGGVLIWSGCTWMEHTPFPDPPFGGVSVYSEADENVIEMPGHPLLDNVVPPFTGNSANHNEFTGIPVQADVILTHPDSSEATLYVLEQGAGLLVVSGLPWEFEGGDNADTLQTLSNALAFGWGYP